MISGVHVKANTSKVNTITLDGPGDLAAPPGSQPWAIAVRLQIQSLLNDSGSSVKQLRTWLEGIEEHSGYSQLTDEDGETFSSYAEFCKAKQPWGLGSSPEIIDKMLKDLELIQEKIVEVEEEKSRSWGDIEQYLQRFSKVIQDCEDSNSISVHQIAKILNIHIKNAYKWKKRWLDLGWIEPAIEGKRGIYTVTDEGRKQAQEWADKMPSGGVNEPLWLTVPRKNPKKAAEELIASLEVEQLKEIYELIGKSFEK
jgi:transposase